MFVVAGHRNALVFGQMGEANVPVVAMLGRVRCYLDHRNAKRGVSLSHRLRS